MIRAATQVFKNNTSAFVLPFLRETDAYIYFKVFRYLGLDTWSSTQLLTVLH